MIIYLVTNILTDKQYVGMTNRKENGLDKYWGSGKLIKNSIKKYGVENFTKEVLQYCFDWKETSDAEIYWIQKLNTLVPNGYNIIPGGKNFITSDSDEYRQFYKNRSTLNPEMYKKIWDSRRRNGTDKHSPEQLARVTLANRKRAQDPIWLNKLRTRNKEKPSSELKYVIQNTITGEILELINIRGVKEYIFNYNEKMGYTNNRRCNHHLLCHLGYTKDFVILKKESAHYAK